MWSWVQNNWCKKDNSPIKNKELIQEYYNLYQQGYRIQLNWIKGHNRNKWNELADQLANNKISHEEALKQYAK